MEASACHAHLVSPESFKQIQDMILAPKKLAHFCRLQLHRTFNEKKKSQVIYDYSCKANTNAVHTFSSSLGQVLLIFEFCRLERDHFLLFSASQLLYQKISYIFVNYPQVTDMGKENPHFWGTKGI